MVTKTKSPGQSPGLFFFGDFDRQGVDWLSPKDPSTMSNPVVSTHLDEHVLYITLNRPDKMNAFNVAMLQGLAEAMTRLEEDSAARCALLTASGGHFTAGLDLAEVASYMQENNGGLFDEELVDPLQLQGRKRSKPVVMAVQGYCLTIGIELILASEITIAHPETRFGQIEVKRGIFPFGGATFRFHQRCGWGNAMRYLLTGDRFDGSTALDMGLVQELSDDPVATATAIAKSIAEQAPLAVQATLSNAKLAEEQGERAAIDALNPTIHQLMQTADAAEGVRSFVERRKANFTGK